MSLLNLEKAINACLSDIQYKDKIKIKLSDSLHRVLAEDLFANKNSPPHDISAMDGYALHCNEFDMKGSVLSVVGKVPAGKRFLKTIHKDEAIRVFTGSRIPDNLNTVVIQENVTEKNNKITINEKIGAHQHIRKKGFDFQKGDKLIEDGTKIEPRHISLAASMNHTSFLVYKKPTVAIISSGDELVRPGTKFANEKIISSNSYGIRSYVEKLGGVAIDIGIAKDTKEDIQNKIHKAKGADIILTIGGASVGEFDLIKESIRDELELKFWKIAMRPGKPLIFGHLNNSKFLGLPGNPVSALVCCQLFLKPMLLKMQNIDHSITLTKAILKKDLKQNDERQDYIRAYSKNGVVDYHHIQDSSSLNVLSRSNVYIVRKPFAEAAKAGELVDTLEIDT